MWGGVLLLGALWSAPAAARSVIDGRVLRLGYRGELRSLATVAHTTADHGSFDGSAAGTARPDAVTSLRLMVWAQATSFLHFDVAYEHAFDLVPRPTPTVPTFADPPPGPHRFLGLDGFIHQSDDLRWWHGFDRLAISLRLPVFRGLAVTIGRQAIAWGYGEIFRPADRFAPERPIEFIRAHAAGVDAVDVRLPLGPASEVRAVLLPSERAADVTALMRAEVQVAGIDLAATTGYERGRGLFGLGSRVAFGPVGLEGEGVVFVADEDQSEGAFAVSVKVALPLRTVGMIAFLYDSRGVAAPADYPALWQSEAYRGGRLILANRTYLAFDVAAAPFEALRIGVRALWGLGDGSAAVHVHAGIAFADEAWIGLSALVTMGAGAVGGMANSEFGSAPYMYTLDLRLHF